MRSRLNRTADRLIGGSDWQTRPQGWLGGSLRELHGATTSPGQVALSQQLSSSAAADTGKLVDEGGQGDGQADVILPTANRANASQIVKKMTDTGVVTTTIVGKLVDDGGQGSSPAAAPGAAPTPGGDPSQWGNPFPMGAAPPPPPPTSTSSAPATSTSSSSPPTAAIAVGALLLLLLVL